ncbi:MAG: UbiD family decarboxylase [Xanthobacteraceae bacterium]
MAARNVDLDKFRLRSFVEKLIAIGEVEVHEEAVSLAELSAVVESSPKAKYFKRVGAEQYEMVAAVSGSRRRLAAAFGTDERNVIHEYMRRMNDPQPVVEVPSAAAPVHQVVLKGDDIDLTRLPFHLQHELDGAPYISSGIDYTVDPATGRNNVGCRRLMFRDRRTMRANLSQPYDLKKCYIACVERGEKLPASFAIGSHPLDYLAAGLRLPGDEFGLVATLRGEPVPMVRGLTNGLLAPADAEMIIEGYFDELGYREQEGPYGEFYGFYGPVHMDPVFHVTAITMRKDVLHQTVFHSGGHLSWTESGNLGGLNAELQIWKALRAAGIEPAAVLAVPASNGRQHVRVALRRGAQGQARQAIAALHAIPRVKHVFVVDHDVDVFSDEQMEWAMSTRFRAASDIVVTTGHPAFYMDPSADEKGSMDKAGFDLTAAYGVPDTIETRRPRAPRFNGLRRFSSAKDALASGPMFFHQIMEALGSKDGREVALELHALHEQGVLTRLRDGEWALKEP